MESFAIDLAHSFRALRRSPGFSAIVILILALGIGTSAAVFTLVDSVLLRPLGYSEPDRLVALWERTPEGEEQNPISPANWHEWRDRAKSFSAIGAWSDRPFNLAARDETAEVVTRITSGDYFSILGSQALLGSTYVPAHETEDVVVLSHEIWQGRFGGDPDIVGETIRINDSPMTVIGVMPADFRSVGGQPVLWIPTEFSREGRGRFLTGVARLAPGVSADQARTEMAGITQQLDEEFPERNRGFGATVLPLHEQATQGVRPVLMAVTGAVALLLLITCANVANLLLGRAAARRKDFALRLSLGATRARLVRRALSESLLIGLAAGVLGLALAVGLTAGVMSALPPELGMSQLQDVRVDWRVLTFSLIVSIGTALLFGIAPAIFASGVRPGESLRESGRGAIGGRSRLRSALVIAEVAIAVVLLSGAGLLARTMQSLLSVDLGIRTENVLTARIALAGERYAEEEAITAFTAPLFERLESVPGVESAGSITYLPLTGEWIGHSFWRADRPKPPEWEESGMNLRPIGGRYFETMGIPLRQGRTFDPRDSAESPRVVVVNQALVDRDFEGESPIGKRISFEWGGATREVFTSEIVGVVGNVREGGAGTDPSAGVYIPLSQLPTGLMSVVIRTTGDPLALAPTVESIVRQIDPLQPVARIRTMEQVAGATVVRQRSTLYLLAGFAAMALLLAGLGLYAIVSWSVTQRRREIGVRVALGARAGDVVRLVAGQAGRMTAAGLVIGLVAGAAGWRLMRNLLFEVQAGDPVTTVAVIAFLAIVALAASALPAWRATKIEPTTALREE